MKKAKLILFLCFMAVLTACGNTNSSTEPAKKEETSKEASKESTQKENKPTSGLLTEIGQWKKDENDSTLTLKKINNKQKEIDLSPIKMKIKDVKVFEYSDLGEKDKEYLSYSKYKKDIYHRIEYKSLIRLKTLLIKMFCLLVLMLLPLIPKNKSKSMSLI
ncbi:hypothetical protein ACSLGF_09125 [Bacillus sp. A015]